MMQRILQHEVLNSWLENSSMRQVDLAEALGVTRQAVFRWCEGVTSPSPERALEIEKMSKGEVRADKWPCRTWTTGNSRASRTLTALIRRRRSSVAELSRTIGLPQRSVSRYISGGGIPRDSALQAINKALGTKLRRADFIEASNAL